MKTRLRDVLAHVSGEKDAGPVDQVGERAHVLKVLIYSFVRCHGLFHAGDIVEITHRPFQCLLEFFERPNLAEGHALGGNFRLRAEVSDPPASA